MSATAEPPKIDPNDAIERPESSMGGFERPEGSPFIEDTTGLAEAEEEKGKESQAEPKPEAEGEAAPSEPVEFGGETFANLDEFKELVSKGRDYTKKTQSVADARREMGDLVAKGQQYQDMEKAFASPEGAKAVIERLSQLADSQHGQAWKPVPKVTIPTVNESELSEEGLKLLSFTKALAAQNEQLTGFTERALKELSDLRTQVSKGGQTEGLAKAADQIEKQFGVRPTAEHLQTYMSAYGQSDPVNAFKIALADAAEGTQKTTAKAATKETKAANPKPNVPSAGGRVADTSNWSADDYYRGLRDGTITLKDLDEQVHPRLL